MLWSTYNRIQSKLWTPHTARNCPYTQSENALIKKIIGAPKFWIALKHVQVLNFRPLSAYGIEVWLDDVIYVRYLQSGKECAKESYYGLFTVSIEVERFQEIKPVLWDWYWTSD